jgi:Family of unknown function (DUF6308)
VMRRSAVCCLGAESALAAPPSRQASARDARAPTRMETGERRSPPVELRPPAMVRRDGTGTSGEQKHKRDNGESPYAGNLRQVEGVRVTTIVLRGGIGIESPLEVALVFLRSYPADEVDDSSPPMTFGERDLRLANRGGARISAVEIGAILDRRGEIEAALRTIDARASLAGAPRSVPWIPLRRLFDAFADIRGVGLSKATKALHPKRQALIPMLDSVVQAYLTLDEPADAWPTFGEHATGLIRRFKQDVDRNRTALRAVQRELASRGFRLTEVRLLDLLIWSVAAGR